MLTKNMILFPIIGVGCGVGILITMNGINSIYFKTPKSNISIQNNSANNSLNQNKKKNKRNENDKSNDNNNLEDKDNSTKDTNNNSYDMSDNDPNETLPKIPPPPLNVSLFKRIKKENEDENFSKNKKKHSSLSYGYNSDKTYTFSPKYIQYIK